MIDRVYFDKCGAERRERVARLALGYAIEAI